MPRRFRVLNNKPGMDEKWHYLKIVLMISLYHDMEILYLVA